jgi:uncharacterized protein YceH (UPF0502 family)
MIIELSALECRVIGCLIEKQVTTPEQYPLSLNALQNACNQKSNREPLMELSESQVQAALDGLMKRHLVLERSGFGSRVPKFQQRLCNTEFSSLQLSDQQRALLCELLLRGAQTPGELRARAARMARFADVAEVESTLDTLARREGGALVRQLPREPGRRETRYAHLLRPAADEEERMAPAAPSHSAPAPSLAETPSLAQRVAALEEHVARLAQQLEALRGS